MTAACDRYRDDLPALAAGTLPPADLDAARDHVAACATCQTALREWQAVQIAAQREAEALGAAPPPLDPVLATIRADGARPGGGRSPNRASVVRDVRRIVAAAAVLALLAIGLAILESPSMTNLRSLLRSLDGSGNRPLAGGALAPDGAGGDRSGSAGAGQTGNAGDSAPVQQGPAGRTGIAVPILRQTTVPDLRAGQAPPSRVGAVGRTPFDGRSTPQAGRAGAAGTGVAAAGTAQAGVGRQSPLGAGPAAGATSPTPTTAPAGAPSTAPGPAATPIPTARPTSAPPTRDPHPDPTDAGPTPGPGAQPTAAGPTPGAGTDPTAAAPSPTAATGIVAGRVLGRDGVGRAEVRVLAFAVERPEDAPAVGVTDPGGDYTVSASAGTYVVVAVDPGFETRWHPDAAEPTGAARLSVAGGSVTSGVDFRLAPSPAGVVTGRVRRVDGQPAPAAMVSAIRFADPSDPDEAGVVVAVALAAADGSYRLNLEPGVYAFAAHPGWWTGPVVWWDARGGPAQRDLYAVDAQARAEGVDFVLP